MQLELVKKQDGPAASTRNQWDGRYRMEGTMTDHSNAAFGWMGNTYLYTLQTSGTATDSLVSNDLAIPGIIIGNTGPVSQMQLSTVNSV